MKFKDISNLIKHTSFCIKRERGNISVWYHKDKQKITENYYDTENIFSFNAFDDDLVDYIYSDRYDGELYVKLKD